MGGNVKEPAMVVADVQIQSPLPDVVAGALDSGRGQDNVEGIDVQAQLDRRIE